MKKTGIEMEKRNYKQDIADAYNSLISKLEELSTNIEQIKGVNSTFSLIQESFNDTVEKKICEAKRQLSSSQKDTIWDRLVIAFFGQTNAGKSTIIEAFRILFDANKSDEDGIIVGDGSPDFTKTYDEYEMTIDNHPFTLIDVPGIEGNEAEFTDGIKKALRKAHCVFYVQGQDTKPDSATAEKIKQYLGDWVKVYSIYNVRGGVGNYDEIEERESLLTPDKLKKEGLIKDLFESLLGKDVYCGCITVQALLALYANAKFTSQREDLIIAKENQDRLLEYFRSRENVMKFSQFQTLVNLVGTKSENFTKEIYEANKQKIVSLARNVIDSVAKDLETQNENIRDYADKLRKFKGEVIPLISATKREIQTKTNSEINKELNKLKHTIFSIIDDDKNEKKERSRDVQFAIKQNLKINLAQIAEKEIQKLNNKIEIKRKGLDGIKYRQIPVPSFSKSTFSIDFDGAIENLDISIGDAIFGGLIGMGVGAFGGPIGIGVGAVIGALGIAKKVIFGDGGKGGAKEEVSKAIETAIKKVKDSTSPQISKISSELDKQSNEFRRSIDKELNNVAQLRDLIEKNRADIQRFIININ